MIDLFREISQTLSHNRLRMMLTGFAVAWGIFMLIVLLSLANGLVNSFQDNMMTRNNNIINVWGGVTSKAWKGFKDGRWIRLRESDIRAITDDNSSKIRGVLPSLSSDTASFRTSTETISRGYMGASPGCDQIDGLDMVTGRFINQSDETHRRRVIIIHRNDAVKVFGSAENAIGKTLSGQGLAWTVAGVYDHRWRSGPYIPYSTAAALQGFKGEVDRFDVEIPDVTSEAEGAEAETLIQNALASAHQFAPDDNSALYINNRFDDSIASSKVMNILITTMWIIGILTLLSGIVGVSNIMFVSVKERTHEIGIRRAIGARPRQILTQIVMESVAITTIFGYIGIVLGTITMAFVSNMIGNSLEMLKNPSVNLSTAFQVTAVLIVAGAIAGLFPAIKATNVRPVEALRDE